MSAKEQVLELVKRLDENATIDHIMYKLELLKNIQIGLEQIEKGQFVDHDELFDELLKEQDEEDQARLVRSRQGKSRGHKKIHQSKRSKNGPRVHKKLASQSEGA
jgi:hypothetical protein